MRRKPRGSGLVRLRAALHHRLPFRRGTPYLLTLYLPPLPEAPAAAIGAAIQSPVSADPAASDELEAERSEDDDDAMPVVEISAGAHIRLNPDLSDSDSKS